ncbi:MAG: hypothetical protein HFJ26_06440 [Clostridia bacterium]|nr:hypothetical protein [Clostridia bacterium]
MEKGLKMIQAYQKILEMESIAELKLEQDRMALEKIRKILYQQKYFILDRLTIYLKRELDIQYFFYKIIDIDGNLADILVKEDSRIFEENIQGKELIEFNVEELIDSRMFDNKDEIIIVDLNFEENLLNLSYLCDSLNYNFLSYSDEIKDKLTTFINYVINKNIYKN